jgi:lysophospholipase L1-like esterase
MRKSMAFVLLALATLFSPCTPAAELQLKPGDYVAVIGDSITEQRIYSLYIEDYLLMCQPAPELRMTQFGWGGETAPGFAGRMANDCLRFKPVVATTCFGMNDGGYSPMNEGKGNNYRNGQRSIVKQLKEAGARVIVVGSPGVVDANTFKRNPESAKMYNQTLAALRDIAKEVAQTDGVLFANVFDPMMDVMTKAKAKYGNNYHVGGGDGVHPDRNGHLVMAYAYLKALGCDGNIGTITVDLGAGKAEASEGHKILSCNGGMVEVESSRYPFCFFGDPAAPSSTRGVLEFLPFNDELNRFRLVVKGATTEKVKVTWGTASKEFATADLAQGVNLAAAFLDNPFCEAFKAAEKRIADKQNMEVHLVKNLIHNLLEYVRRAPNEKDALDRVGTALVKEDVDARNAAAESVKPVKHQLTIEAVK